MASKLSNTKATQAGGINLKKILLGLGGFIIVVFLLAMMMTAGIADSARAQLKAINKGDYVTAYALTSKAFQQSTSLEDFKTFIPSYPVLGTNKGFSINSRETNGDQGKIIGMLEAMDGRKMNVEYQFMKEGNDWKILSINLTSPGSGTIDTSSTQKDSSGAEIPEIMISDIADKDGYVENPKPYVPSGALKIFATVQLINPKEGSAVSATLIHPETGSKVGPVSAVVDKTGNILKAFSFTRENNEWPKGEYMIEATLATGAVKKVSFTVR